MLAALLSLLAAGVALTAATVALGAAVSPFIWGASPPTEELVLKGGTAALAGSAAVGAWWWHWHPLDGRALAVVGGLLVVVTLAVFWPLLRELRS